MGWYSENGSYQRTWRPVSIADVDRFSVSWSRRLEARNMLDEMTFRAQKTAASCALGRTARDSEVTVLPQRAPLHAQYPAFPAARACIGLSAISQYNALVKASCKWLTVPTERISSVEKVDPQALQQTRSFVVEAVGNRVCLDHLLLFEGISAVESYRLFAAAILDLRFRRLRDLILGACLMGDLVFALLSREPVKAKLHPLSEQILTAMVPAIVRYRAVVSNCNASQLPTHGSSLAVEILAALIPFLPAKSPGEPARPPAEKSPPRAGNRVGVRKPPRTSNGKELSLPLLGMDEVMPPSIEEPNDFQTRPNHDPQANPMTPDPSSNLSPSTRGDNQLPTKEILSPEQQRAQVVLQQAALVLTQATGREAWHDPRVDQVADAIRRGLFKPGVVEAELTGARYKVQVIGADREGALREEVLPRCRDMDALDRVRKGALPIHKQLRRFRWFGERDDMSIKRFQTCGPFDPLRLYTLGTSELIRRRWLKHAVTDYRGRPVVVLAKDGSSSNTLETTFAGQILTAAFLQVEKLAHIRVVAADYSSSSRGSADPLVRWLYHPQKTPRANSVTAVDAVASLPRKGEGGNEDVLSVSHILQETFEALGRDQSFVVINITDGRFNSPIDQVRKMIATLRKDYHLTYSLIILGDFTVDVPEVNYLVRVPGSELTDPNLVAQRIAKHVNTLVLARRRRNRQPNV